MNPMRNLSAAIYFLLALFGCDGGGATLLDRATIDGIEALYSETRVRAGVARFECVASASGRCHYTLLPPRCATPGAKPSDECRDAPVERFSIAAGTHREVVGLPEFGVCVSDDAGAPARGCRVPR